MNKNLLFIPALDLSGHRIVIENKTVKVLCGEHEVLRGKMAKNWLYYLDLQVLYVPNLTANRAQALQLSDATALAAKLRSSMELAHCHFSHFGVKALTTLPNAVDRLILETKSMWDCEACALVKSHKLPYAKSKTKEETVPGREVSMDLKTVSDLIREQQYNLRDLKSTKPDKLNSS